MPWSNPDSMDSIIKAFAYLFDHRQYGTPKHTCNYFEGANWISNFYFYYLPWFSDDYCQEHSKESVDLGRSEISPVSIDYFAKVFFENLNRGFGLS